MTGPTRLHGEDPEREIDDELAFHMEGRLAELEARGWTRERALEAVRAEFGDVEATRRYCAKEDHRRLRKRAVQGWGRSLLDDGAQAARRLLRRPGEVAAPAAILAVGVALNALVFTVVRGVLLAPLPVASPERVFVLEEQAEQGGLSRASYPVLEAWREGAPSLEVVAAYLENDLPLAVRGGEPRHVAGAAVTEGFFALFDAPMRLGRALAPPDHAPGAPPVAVISEGLWKDGWGGDPGVLGAALDVEGVAYRVVGVAARDARLPDAAQWWLPVERTAPGVLEVAGAKIFVALGRVRPGVDPAALADELGALSAAVPGGAPSAAVTLLDERTRGEVRAPLLLLQGAVLLVLLAACANAGGMLLARSVRRRADLAVRGSLGAGRGRIARTLLLEGSGVGALAGVVGLVVAVALLGPVLALVPPGLPRAGDLHLDPVVASVALGLALLTGLATALVPALAGARTPPAALLREAGGGAGETPWLRRLMEGFVVGQVALALLLTAGAGLLIRSFVATVGEDPGFDPDRVTVVEVALPEHRYPDEPSRHQFARTLLERAAGLPGAQAVAVGRNLPISGSNMTSPLQVEGLEGTTAAVQVAPVSARYFEVMGIPLVEGTGFGDADRAGGAAVLVVGQGVEASGGGTVGVGDRARSFFGGPELRDVTGVVGAVRHGGLRADPAPVAYEPFFQRGVLAGFSLLVRSSAPPAVVAASARDLLRELDPQLPADRVGTMAARIRVSVAGPRFYAAGLGAFGVLAVLLALAGSHAGLAHRVAARRRELGLRLALGASESSVRRMVVRRGLVLTVAGAALGLAAALPVLRLLDSQLYGVTPLDPWSYAAGVVVLLAAGWLAAEAPARRASRVPPADALRP